MFSNRTMPVDHTDYYGTHMVAAEEREDGQFYPLMAFKCVTLERCQKYHAQFPCMAMIKHLNSSVHATALEKILSELDCGGEHIAYGSSFAIDPNLSLEDRIEMLELMYPLWFYYIQDFGIKVAFSFGTVESKVFKILAKLGLELFKFEDRVLAPVASEIFYGQSAYLQLMDRCSSICQREARRADYLDLWVNRIHFDDPVTTARNSKREQLVEHYFQLGA